MLLEGRVAVVTGASRGLGAAFARRFAREGASVAIAAKDESRLKQVADEIEAEGGKAFSLGCDVTDLKQVADFARATLDYYGHVDVLVNNAGALKLVPFLEETDEEWDYMLTVNLNSARWVTKAFLPSMLDRGSGKIIFISSNAAKRGFPNDAGYTVAKAGLAALSNVLAVEFGTKGIDVHTVCPGLVAETDMGEYIVVDHIEKFEGSREKFWEWANPLSPKGFHPTVQEVEDVVTFLASSRSTVLHGTVLSLDHGFTPY